MAQLAGNAATEESVGTSRGRGKQVVGNGHFRPQNCKLHADGTAGPSLPAEPSLDCRGQSWRVGYGQPPGTMGVGCVN